MPRILKRTLRETGPEKEEYLFHENADLVLSRKGKSIKKLDPVLKRAGLRKFSSSSLSNCFKRAISVPPFNVDGFETRNKKLVCNLLKKKVLMSSSN